MRELHLHCLKKILELNLNNKLPGIYPKIVNKMLMKKSAQHPFSKKTPSGGNKIAKRTLQISEQVSGI